MSSAFAGNVNNPSRVAFRRDLRYTCRIRTLIAGIRSGYAFMYTVVCTSISMGKIILRDVISHVWCGHLTSVLYTPR